ncbi:hypothetical protein Hdeb2414_s0063g00765071 [Helianthus debilis subsp. tardiflorus]
MFRSAPVHFELQEFMTSDEINSALHDDAPRYDDDGTIADEEEYLFVKRAISGIADQEGALQRETSFCTLSGIELYRSETNKEIFPNGLKEKEMKEPASHNLHMKVDYEKEGVVSYFHYKMRDVVNLGQQDMVSLMPSNQPIKWVIWQWSCTFEINIKLERKQASCVERVPSSQPIPYRHKLLCRIGYPSEIPPEPPPDIHAPSLRTDFSQEGEDDRQTTSTGPTHVPNSGPHQQPNQVGCNWIKSDM